MLCPKCGKEVEVVYVNNVKELHCVVHRGYKCGDCELGFKTTEKVLFTSLPNTIRNHFLETGERGI